MSDQTTQTPSQERERDRIQPVDLQMEMQRSYLDYAMSVIVGRGRSNSLRINSENGDRYNFCS